MAQSSHYLYIRRGGQNYAINLYTASSDTGTPAFTYRLSGANLFAKIVDTTDSRASYLRARVSSVIKAVASTALKYIATWTQFGSVGVPDPANPGTVTTSYSVTVDYNILYSTGSLYNVKIVWTPYGDNGSSSASVSIDGTVYTLNSTTTYYRLSTGTHTIVLYGVLTRSGGSDPSYGGYSSVGSQVVPA